MEIVLAKLRNGTPDWLALDEIFAIKLQNFAYETKNQAGEKPKGFIKGTLKNMFWQKEVTLCLNNYRRRKII